MPGSQLCLLLPELQLRCLQKAPILITKPLFDQPGCS